MFQLEITYFYGPFSMVSQDLSTFVETVAEVIVVRAARAAKLGARAGRLSRVGGLRWDKKRQARRNIPLGDLGNIGNYRNITTKGNYR